MKYKPNHGDCRVKNLTIVILAVLISLSTCTFAETKTLQVEVRGLETISGQLILTVYDKPEDFLKTAALTRIEKVEEGPIRFSINGLREGRYAISVFHDEDGDGELKMNFLGIPKELTGFANQAQGNMGPPSFEDASIEISEDRTILIKLGKI